MTRPERTESVVQVLILLLVAGMAGAASFTHVHDWTMRNAPAATASWFGWANAVISELTPTAAGIEIRRRKRHGHPVAYPMAVLIAAAVLSLTAQVAEARPTPAGWISSAVPALAFLALTKLVLSRTTVTPGEPPCLAPLAPTPDRQSHTTTAGTSATATSAPAVGQPTPATAAAPAAPSMTPDRLSGLLPVPSGQLLMSAHMTAFSHQQQTGHPITPGQLADRLAIPEPLAGSLLDHLGGTPPPVTAANGTTAIVEGQP